VQIFYEEIKKFPALTEKVSHQKEIKLSLRLTELMSTKKYNLSTSTKEINQSTMKVLSHARTGFIFLPLRNFT
jgi:hypothetical protein